MILRDCPWKLKYSREDGNLVSKFYIPALSCAIRYDRITGYFRAGSLALAARGIEHLILNGGKMRLLVGCTLEEDEIKAIERGTEMAELIGRKADVALPASVDLTEHEALELLAWMISRRMLEVRIGVPCHEQSRKPVVGSAIFHEKTGIIEDKTGDRIAFSGSINETVQGWMHNGETFSVFTTFGGAAAYVDEEERSFQMYWNDQACRTRIYDFPDALAQDLLRFLPPDDDVPRRLKQLLQDNEPELPPETHQEIESPDWDAERHAIWQKILDAAQSPDGGIWVGEATSPMEAWPHQRKAFLRMYGQSPDHAPKLLIADEVGLGKTVQAGLLIRQSWMAGRLKRGLILAPANVCTQWQSELREKFALDWPLYDGKAMRRYDVATQQYIDTPVSRASWHEEPFIIMSSHLARRRDRRPELLEAEPWDIVFVDEAHHARNRRNGDQVTPNMLMRLLRELRHRTKGLVLLSATPLQTHAMELYDLLSLLGMPAEWDAISYDRYFAALSEPHMGADKLEECARLYRATEAYFGPVTDEWARKAGGQAGSELSKIQTRRILSALRSTPSIPRRKINSDPADRAAAIRIMKRWTPVTALMSRHTRALLRRYQAQGKLAAQIAFRQVADRFIDMDPAERDIYERVEEFLRNAYQSADTAQKNAIGFILTVYRKRLSSSFSALASSLRGRLERAVIDDQFDLEEAGDETDSEDLLKQEEAARRLLESSAIEEILQDVAKLPVDTKARQLLEELAQFTADGYSQTMVFTGYTDTMDGLRDWVAEQTGREVICFSGRGGEIRTPEGDWKIVSRAEIKKRFKNGQGDILLCTDAAAEGLNFQFCGSLINYDMPWNPMRVEQRIGRIDRLGQRFENIRIINLHYNDTVETAVYVALSSRIKLFEDMVGGLQPILSAVSKEIGALALAGANVDVEYMVSETIAGVETPNVDIDDLEDLDDMPELGWSPLSLEDLQNLANNPRLLPDGYIMKKLDEEDFAVEDPVSHRSIRATLSRSFYTNHFEHTDFWTPGSRIFPCNIDFMGL